MELADGWRWGKVPAGLEVAKGGRWQQEKLGNEDLVQGPWNHGVTSQKYLNMDD